MLGDTSPQMPFRMSAINGSDSANQTATLSILHEQSVNIHKRLTKALFSRNSVLLGHCHEKTHKVQTEDTVNVRRGRDT